MHEPALLVEELFWMVGAHPPFETCELLGVRPHARERHLVGAERTLDRQTVYLLRPGPALRGAEHDRWPAGAPREAILARLTLDGSDLLVAPVECSGKPLVHAGQVVPLDEVDRVAMPFEYRADLVIGRASQHGGVGDFVAVEVQDREHGTVASRVQEAYALPGALQGSGLGLAVTDDRGDEEVRVIEGRAEGVREDVAELAALVDRAGGGHADVTRHTAGRRELPEEPLHSRCVLRDLRVDLGVGAFQVDVRQDGRAAVPGASQVDGLGVTLLDQAVEVDVDKAETG